MRPAPKTIDAYLATLPAPKSALHFEPEAGLPATLVRKLIKARIAETK